MKLFEKEIEYMMEQNSANETAIQYFEGDIPQLYMSDSFRRKLRGAVSGLRLNHARTVVTALVNRLEVNSIVGSTDKSSKAIAAILRQNGKGELFNDLFTKASVFGQAFVMAWPDQKGDWRLSVHDPTNTYVKYDVESPWIKEYAFRVFQDGDNVRMNVFYADRIEKYIAASEGLATNLNWSMIERIENPYGQVPMFHLRNDAQEGRPEHYDAYNSQDAINKLVSTHMETVEYQGAPQRYALANVEQTGEAVDFDEDSADRANLEALKNGPGELWYLKGVNSVGAFNAADPGVFWNPIGSQIVTMASLTETPLHYFTGEVVSGPALRAAEAPLIKKAERRQEQYTLPIEEMFSFILGVDSMKSGITINWNDGQSIDALEEWDIFAKKRNVGIPLRQVLIEAGYGQQEIEQVMVWAKEEAKEAASFASYKRSNPTVRVQEDNDETKIETGEVK